jgi:RND family efflux transporter MFP subunit
MKASLLRYTGPILVLATGIGLFAILRATAPEPETEESSARPVTVYTHIAERVDTVLSVETQGEVRARTSIDLTAQVSGRVVSVSPQYIEGGRFDADTVLLKIEDTDYRLALREAEAAVAAAELGVQQALADAEVAQKQLRGDPNPSDLALKKPQIEEARARREAALAALEQAELNFERTAVRLPFAGRVASTAVHVGEYVAMGNPLGRVFATDEVQVRLPLNDQQLSALGLPIGYAADNGDAPTVTLSAEVAGREQQWRGQLTHIDAAMDSATRLIYATAIVDDPYGAGRSEGGMPLAVGLFVNARIDGRTVRGAVRIPSHGLRPGNQLFVVDNSGLLDIREAVVEHLSADYAVISEGLRPGERLVVSALRNPISGMALATIDEQRYARREN